MPSIRIYQKKQIRLDRLNFRQTQMFKIGNVGVAAVKNRLAAAEGPTDGSAKPLTKRYAIWKTKLGKGNRRNLMLSGDMQRNFQVRTVSENGEGQQFHAQGPDQGMDHQQDRAVDRVLGEEQDRRARRHEPNPDREQIAPGGGKGPRR